MKKTMRQVEIATYASEAHPNLTTKYESMVPLLEWLDANPVAYKIVTSGKSKAFGLGSCDHIGWAQRGGSTCEILERLGTLHRAATFHRTDADFHVWRARFTLAHFGEKGFRGGFFQHHALWNGQAEVKEYPRSCISLDYTPETLEEVLDRFAGWMDPTYVPVTRITVDGVDKRSYERPAKRE